MPDNFTCQGESTGTQWVNQHTSSMFPEKTSYNFQKSTPHVRKREKSTPHDGLPLTYQGSTMCIMKFNLTVRGHSQNM
jgi:hypothetical protein